MPEHEGTIRQGGRYAGVEARAFDIPSTYSRSQLRQRFGQSRVNGVDGAATGGAKKR